QPFIAIHIYKLHNVTHSTPFPLLNFVNNSNHWLVIRLVAGPKSPRDAIGSKVFVTTGAIRQRGDVFSGGSYASSSDPRLHFGLATATKVDTVEIQWTSGIKEERRIPYVNRLFTVS